MCICRNIEMCICRNIEMCICRNIEMCICRNIEICICRNIEMCICRNIEMCICRNIEILEGTAPYGHLLLAPAEGWWPSATWRALWALWIALNKQKIGPPFFFIGGPHLYPPCRRPPYPLHRFFFLLPYQFLFQSDNFSILPHILPHILPQILPQTTTSIAIHPPPRHNVFCT